MREPESPVPTHMDGVIAILDYGTTPNAIFGGGPTPGTVSFRVLWSGVDQRLNIKNTEPVYGGFADEFVRNSAQMEWSAAVGDYRFVSDPIATSSVHLPKSATNGTDRFSRRHASLISQGFDAVLVDRCRGSALSPSIPCRETGPSCCPESPRNWRPPSPFW
jgi:hypothetical protein